MYSFEALNIHEALDGALSHLLNCGVEESSRNGPVLVAPEPVCIEFLNPRERVLYAPTRDANPWFHLFESLWMISGDNDIEFPCYFNSTYGKYSDDGRTMWDAYGWRWRRFFGWDQLEAIIQELRSSPTSRRCVLSMWNAMPQPKTADCNGILAEFTADDFFTAIHGGKAVPCNTHAYVDLRGGQLNLTVMNRSNDLLFGMLGANVVHMSFLAEYLAMRVGVPLGVYRQFTVNMHAYTEVFSREKLANIADECAELLHLDGEPLPSTGPTLEAGFDEDLKIFMPWARALIRGEDDDLSCDALSTTFFTGVARPMFDAWYWRKKVDAAAALETLNAMTAPDWQRAGREWVLRRKK